MGSLSRVVPCGGGRLHDGGERPARREGRKCVGKRPDDCHDSAESLEEKWRRSRSTSPPCWSGLKGRHHGASPLHRAPLLRGSPWSSPHPSVGSSPHPIGSSPHPGDPKAAPHNFSPGPEHAALELRNQLYRAAL